MNVGGGGVTVTNVVVDSGTSLRVTFTVAANATSGPRNVTVTTKGGTSNARPFTVNATPPPEPDPPTLTNVSPDDGLPDETVAVTLTGTNFIVGGTKVIVAGGGVTVTNVVVSSTTSLTANFELDSAAPTGPHTVTVETKGGTSNGLPFTVNALPPPTGDQTFDTVGSHTFPVPDRVTTLTVTVRGAQGGFAASGGRGGSVTATLTVVPDEILNIFVGGQGQPGTAGGAGGFNGGGAGGTGTSFFAGGGGGASDIRRGGSALSDRIVVAGGGGGSSFFGIGGARRGHNGWRWHRRPAQRDCRWRWHAE